MNNVRISIQNKGRLTEPSINFLKQHGLDFDPNGRNCLSSCRNQKVDIVFLRDDDIPAYVERGISDFGIIGENVLLEKNTRVKIVKKLDFGLCSLMIAVPKDSRIKNIKDLNGSKIATTYPNLVGQFLADQDIDAEIIALKGSVEIAPGLNMADAICDLVQTGNTLKANNLKSLGLIFESQAVLIQCPFVNNRKVKEVEELLSQERLVYKSL